MKEKILVTLLLLVSIVVGAQPSRSRAGAIVLTPYVAANETNLPRTREMLLDKLHQIVNENGLSSVGTDDRFVITAHVQSVATEVTGTVPQKTAARLSVTFYIGNGVSGTLFASHNMELRGIGSTKDQAYMNAIRKIPVTDAALQRFLAQGKRRVVEYYDQAGPSIVAAAKAAAGQGEYVKAIDLLLAIPQTSSAYSEAQTLMGRYGKNYLARINAELLNQARAVWSASLSSSAAQQARRLLSQLQNPTAAEQAEAKALSNEMARKLRADEAREWQLLENELQRAHERELARIEQQEVETIAAARVAEAAAQVAVARYESRPRTVYHLHWW